MHVPASLFLSSYPIPLTTPTAFPVSHPRPFSLPISLLHPRANSSPPPSPIFLPHLTSDTQCELRGSSHSNEAEGDDDVNRQEDYGSDPIVTFFHSRIPKPDPTLQGRVSFQRNRRSSWHLAPPTFNDSLPDEDNGDPYPQFHSVSYSENQVPTLDTEEDEGTVGEILRMARNLPENTTLGELMGPFEGKIGEGECIELLKRMGEEGLQRSCLFLWEWMRLQRTMLISSRACSVLFPVLGKAGMGEELVVLFGNLPRERRFRDVHVYNAAIAGLACCGRYNDAWKVYDVMEADNVMPDHVTCSTLISMIRRTGGSAKEAWELFQKMNRKGLEWRLETVGALMKSFCAEGMKKEALIIQSEMEKKGIQSNVVIYNTLMDAYVKSDQIEEAEGLFYEMKEKGLTPTVVTYNVLMDAYSRRMQPETIEKLLEEMEALDLKPNVKSYTCLISAYGRQRKLSDLAANAFFRMKKAGIKPTSQSYTALIHAYSVGGWHEKALSVFEDMKRRKISPSVETYTALLDAFRRAGDASMLMKIWKSMTIDKIGVTRVTFNILLDGLAKQGMYVQARDVVHEFGRLGMSPTVMTYNMLMNAYARGGQHSKLPQLLKEMGGLTLKPDSVTYSTMIYAYIRVRDFRRAFFYHKEMVKSGQVPDAKSYHKLREILDVKAATKNKRDKSAILGIMHSKLGLLKSEKGKKDEFWKNKKKRSPVVQRICKRDYHTRFFH